VDGVLVVALLGLAEEEIWRVGVGGPARIAVPLSTIGIAALAWRRTQPLRALVVVIGALTLLLAGGIEVLGVGLAMVVADYSAAAYAPTRRVSLLAGSVVAGGVAVSFIAYPKGNVGDLVVDAFFAATAWAVGESMRRRKAHTRGVELRADELDRRRHDDARAAAGAERTRIARELHDVIAHNLSAIVLQAIGGRGVLTSDPQRVAQPLDEIEKLGRETLVEMRRLLGILRVGDEVDGRSPQPGLGDLDGLIAQSNSNGIATSLTTDGDYDRVPRGLGLTVARIVQEGLTNVRKHAGVGATATVAIHVETEGVDLVITDDGHGRPLTGPGTHGGHGLLGMRERVAVFGGTLQACPVEPAGFEIHAFIPLGAAPDGAIS
jgi:signal transduction histidine kinase